MLVLKLDDDIISTFLYLLSAALQAESRHYVNRMLLFSIFLEIFSSHYGIPFPPFSISLLAKISVRKVCFIIAFSVFFLCVLQFVCCCLCCLYSPPRFWSCVPLCCATSAVVRVTFAPPVRLYLVFLRACVVFFEVAVYFLLLLLLLRRCGSVLSWCLLVAGVSSWFCGLLGVSCCWCVLLLVGVGVFGVCVLLLVLFCFGLSAVLWSSWCWCCSCCVSCVVALLSVLLLLVAGGASGGSWFGCVAPPLFAGVRSCSWLVLVR